MASTFPTWPFRRGFAGVLVGLALPLVMGGVATPTHAQPRVVISEIYGAGGNTGSVYNRDFIELFNAGNQPQNLTGWSIQYYSAQGTAPCVGCVTPLPAVYLLPGRHYLVGLAIGANLGGPPFVPTPDTVGTTALSATNGKVAIVSNSTPLSAGACPPGPSVVDFVGYGPNANCFEGSGPTLAPSATTSVSRGGGGYTDTNNNASDFFVGYPTPQNSGGTLVAGADATYIYVPIHGQVVGPVNSCGGVAPPCWFNESITDLSDAFRTINPRPSGTGTVGFSVVPGAWAEDTQDGFSQIVASRALYVLAASDPVLLDASRLIARIAARHLEDAGRSATSTASRRAASRIARSVENSIEGARGSSGMPVFVDIVGHSRGGSVAAEVLRQIRHKSTPNQPVYFSLTLLDAIDPSGGPTHQLNELAGDLLGDPVIGSGLPAGRSTSFYAETACCGFFPFNIDTLMLNYACPLCDWQLIAIGYPHGRQRSTSWPQAAGQMMPGRTHITISDQFAATAAGPYPPPVPTEFAFSHTTRIGQLLNNPTQALGPLLMDRCSGCPFSPRTDPPVTEFVTDPTFALACAAVSSVQTAIATPEILALLTPDLEPVPSIMLGIAGSGWVANSSWQRSVGTATCTANAASVPGSETIWQDLNSASIGQPRLRVKVSGTIDPNGSVLVGFTGDGYAFSETIEIVAGGTFALDRVITRGPLVGSGALDRLSVSGGVVRVTLASVGPGCLADFNTDGTLAVQDIFDFLNAWFAGDPRANFNGINGLEVQDIFDFLNAWFAGCP